RGCFDSFPRRGRCPMAMLNKVLLIGRVISETVETRTFTSGGKVAKFRVVFNFMAGKKNPETGQWEGGESVFLDVEVFNREGGRQLADWAEQHLRKMSQVYVEGRLRMNEWTGQDGQKKSKMLVVADGLELLQTQGMAGAGGA